MTETINKVIESQVDKWMIGRVDEAHRDRWGDELIVSATIALDDNYNIRITLRDVAIGLIEGDPIIVKEQKGGGWNLVGLLKDRNEQGD